MFTKTRRIAQNLTRNFQWFKRVQTVASDTAGNIGISELATNVDSVPDFTTYGTLYSQFKVMKMIVKLFPANVGGESMQVTAAGGLPQFQRGNAVTYCGKVVQPGISIPDLIGKPSARLFNTRRYHKRWVNRPKSGYDTWGELSTTGGVSVADEWDDESGIHMQGENFTPVQAPGQQNYFYVMTLWKVVFRARQE